VTVGLVMIVLATAVSTHVAGALAAQANGAVEGTNFRFCFATCWPDRFKLAAHREQREVAGFALRVGPGGHRLVEAKGERTFLTGRPGLIAGNGRSIAELPVKMAIDVVVVDTVEKAPTEN